MKTNLLKKRENRAKARIANARRAVELVEVFFAKGFTSLIALVAIAKNYYPELKISEVNNFWHFRNVSDDLLLKMENILEQLKNE